MKKIISFVLCAVMICGFSVTALAEDAAVSDGAVLYSATFDGSSNAPTSLEDAGLKICAPSTGFSAAINNENGHLTVKQTEKYSNIGITDVDLTGVSSYTMQLTFRWCDPFTNAAAGINPCVSGYNVKTNKRSALNAANIRFNSNRENIEETDDVVARGTPMVEYYGELNNDVLAAWKPAANAFDQIPGNWVTVTVEVNEGSLGKLSVAVVGVETVTFDKPAVAEDMPDGNPYLRFGNAMGVEIFDIRIVAGIDQNVQPPTLPKRPVLQSGSDLYTVDPGKVLYYQRFNKAFDIADLKDTGLEIFEDATERVTVDDSGYLRIDNATEERVYRNMVQLPDVVPENLATYTWETKFRFISALNHGCISPSWGVSGVKAKFTTHLRYKQNGKFDNVATVEPVDSNLVGAWLADDWGAGGWVTLKYAVEDGFLSKVTVTVTDKYSDQEIVWSTDSPEYDTIIPFDEAMVLRFGPEAVVQVESIRVVEGVDYTEYKGDYATVSYSGHDDSDAVLGEDDDMPTFEEQGPVTDTETEIETESEADTETETESDVEENTDGDTDTEADTETDESEQTESSYGDTETSENDAEDTEELGFFGKIFAAIGDFFKSIFDWFFGLFS